MNNVETVLDHPRIVARAESLAAFLEEVGSLVAGDNAQNQGCSENECLFPADSPIYAAQDDCIHHKPDLNVGENFPDFVCERGVE